METRVQVFVTVQIQIHKCPSAVRIMPKMEFPNQQVSERGMACSLEDNEEDALRKVYVK